MDLIFTKKGRGTRFPNEYYECEDCIKIKLHSEKEGDKFLIIDKEDFEKVNICNWKLRKDSQTFYGLNSTNGFIHRLITNCPKDKEVDHIDGDGLNNRKTNLRIVDGKENLLNKHNAKTETGVLGVIYNDGKYPRFRVTWREDGKQKTKGFT